MNMNDELLDRFLDDDATEEERRFVLDWLESDASHVDRLAQRAEMHADLRRSIKRRSIQADALSFVEQAYDADGSRLESEAGSSIVTGQKAKFALAAVAVGLATVAALVLVFFRPSTMVEERPQIAKLAYQINAEWAKPRQDGTSIDVGLLQLKVGLARLDFANGASLTLQGPAALKVINRDQTRLEYGLLTANVPRSAIGFRVDTPSIKVVDLGTAFGVSVGSDGMTNVAVFEGEVEVNRQADSVDDEIPRRVVEGQAIQADRMSSTIESVEFETARYEQAWPINSGVLQTSGVMKFVSPGPAFVPGRYEDSEHILVFPERRGVLLESPVRVDIMESGEYRRLRERQPKLIEAGEQVRSYLLQLNPLGRDRAVAMGQITFDKPILGLIASTTKLAQSDAMLGHPEGIYSLHRRGIEPPRTIPPAKPDRDTVILAADKRTLILSLGAGSALDQIRVIVRDTDPSWSDPTL